MGVVLACDAEPESAKLKFLFDVAPASACLTPELLRLVHFLKERTFCTYYEAVKAVIPYGAQYKPALAADGVTLRGLYDVTGMRAEADLMVWLHTTPGPGDDPASLQKALRALRRTRVLADFQAVWSVMGVHREAEFNKRHVPGYLRGEHARLADPARIQRHRLVAVADQGLGHGRPPPRAAT